MDFSTLPDGLYLLKGVGERGEFVNKFIKE